MHRATAICTDDARGAFTCFHLRNRLIAAQVYFLENEFGVYHRFRGAALALARRRPAHEHVRQRCVTAALRHIVCLEEAGAAADELVHARPLLLAADGNRNTCSRSAILVDINGAAAVWQGRVEEIAQGGSVCSVEEGGEIADEVVECQSAVRPESKG